MKFESKSNRCISRKYIWKIHLKYGGDFFQASLCYQTDHLQNIMNTIMYLMPLHRGGFAHFRLLHTVSPSSWAIFFSLQWRHNGRDGVSKNQAHHCLLNRLFRRRSKKTPKLLVTGLCAGKSPMTGEFPAQMASNARNISIWLRHHVSGSC